MVKAVVFDLDDTLISEREYIESGYRHVSSIISKDTGISADCIYEELISLLNESSKNVFDRFYSNNDLEVTQNKIMSLVHEYRSHSPIISLYADVLPCLDLLKTNGVQTGIITDGYAISQKQKLKAINAYSLFDEIIITDDLGREFWKPHPMPFELMRDKLGINFDEMIYIGDNPEKDFYIQSLYPIITVRINRKGFYSDSGYLNDISEDYSINSLYELKYIL